MSISSEITRITNNVQNTIDTIEATGVTVPEGANSNNLPSLAAALANEKQDKLTGTQGQVVGFDEDGNAVPRAAGVTSFNGRTGAVTPQSGDYTADMVGARPSTWTPTASDVGAIPNPSGGTPGQMLYQGESGPKWGIPPYLGSMPQLDYSQMKSLHALGITDLNDVVEPGTYVGMSNFGGYPEIANIPEGLEMPFFYMDVYVFDYPGDDYNVHVVEQHIYTITAPHVGFNRYSNSDSPDEAPFFSLWVPNLSAAATKMEAIPGLSADNVQDALEELASRKGIFLVKAESQSGTLMADKTLSEIHQAIDDGLVPFLLYVSTSSFIPLYGTTDPTQSVMFVSNYGAYTTVYTVMSDQTITVTQTDSTPKRVTITLTASGWSNNTQTVTVSGVSADETAQLIMPVPALASQTAYYEAGILVTGQAANSLTFTCSTVPSSNLTVYVVMQEVQ